MHWNGYIAFLAVLLFFSVASAASAVSLYDHFLGPHPECVSKHQPVLIVADVTRSGEIDDTISLSVYRHLETLGCIKVIGVVSIHGNGGSSTKQVHHYLTNRLRDLGIDDWEVFHGPDETLPFLRSKKAGLPCLSGPTVLLEPAGFVQQRSCCLTIIRQHVRCRQDSLRSRWFVSQ